MTDVVTMAAPIWTPFRGALRGRTVIIDPGHGGSDPGAVAPDGTREAQLALAIGLQLRDILRAAGLTVVMTREDDHDVSLDERVAIANRVQGEAVYVSVHLNAAADPAAHGREVWALPGGRAIRIAAAVDYWLGALCGLADRYKPGPEECGPGTRWYVLRKTTMPAILVEGGFVTNAAELALLREPTCQLREALAIALGLCDYWTSAS